MTRSERVAEQLEWYWHKNLRPRLDGLTDQEYFWEPVRGCWSIHARSGMENRVLHVNRELIHHGAEISLLRDLYRWRDGAAPHRI
ncbi:hypothetical protein [Streptomyces sp. NPDC127038]|uniref:hypothetical protein n=1 Tax=Streptomyces sp. NPDC127038 TaxID=3347114 RepID=UPI00365EDC42